MISPNFPHQLQSFAAQPPGNPCDRLLALASNFHSTESIVFEGMCCFSWIDGGSEDVVQAKLPWEDVFCNMDAMIRLSDAGMSLQGMCMV
jgi:hypothetical protein